MIVNHAADLIGATPLIPIPRFETAVGVPPGCHLLLKVEGQNPGRSVKDRLGLALVGWMRRERPRARTIVESTSGNTGIGLALAASREGLSTRLIMDGVSTTYKRLAAAAFGAQIEILELTSDQRRGQLGVGLRVARARALEAADFSYANGDQYGNKVCPRWHYETTGPEIGVSVGHLDAVVASVGTGSTISGVGRYVKEHLPDCIVVAVEPSGSVIFGGPAGPYRQPGAGNPFVPTNYEREFIDMEIKVEDDSAEAMAQLLARCEGVLVGASTGGALFAATQVAAHLPEPRASILVISSDDGFKYLWDSS